MKVRKLIWLGAGIAAGGYVWDRQRRNRGAEPRPLVDHLGRELEPREVELAGGERIEVVEAGDGPPIVFVPGLSGDKEAFRYQISDFSRRYRVIAPDLRLSFEGVPREFDQFADDVATVLDAFGERSAVVMGLSFGGPIVIRFARLYAERLKALILSNTLIRLDLDHVGLNRTLLIPVALLSTRYLPRALVRRLARLWGRLGVWVYEPSAANERVVEYELDSPIRVPVSHGSARMDTFRQLDLRADLPQIDQPALVIRGAADTYCLPEWQDEIVSLLPSVEYVEIPEAGHLALISHAETFNRAVWRWLDGLPDDSAIAPPRSAESA